MSIRNRILRWLAAAFLSVALTASGGEGVAARVRAVSLSPNLTELVFDLGLGACLVARTTACDYPPACLAVPVVGDFGRPNWEVLRSLHPDVVLATDVERPELLGRLKESGILVLFLPCESWSQLDAAAIAIGKALGVPERGVEWVEKARRRRSALAVRTAQFYGESPRPRIYAEVWGDPLTTVGAGTFLSEVIVAAGGRNIAEALRGEYIHASAEWVIRENPDVILAAYMLKGQDPGPALRRRLGWLGIKAVREGAICSGIDPDLLLRPGPRLLDGAEQLADWLMKHADVPRPVDTDG